MVKGVVFQLGVVALAQAPTAPHKGGNPEAAKLKNLIEATAESVAAGGRAYQRLCVRCHGAQGTGDGGAAGAVPADLTDAQWEYGAATARFFRGPRRHRHRHEGDATRMSDADISNAINDLRTVAEKPQ
jgi:mono/diheme cytochrome c family protein